MTGQLSHTSGPLLHALIAAQVLRAEPDVQDVPRGGSVVVHRVREGVVEDKGLSLHPGDFRVADPQPRRLRHEERQVQRVPGRVPEVRLQPRAPVQREQVAVNAPAVHNFRPGGEERAPYFAININKP